MTQPSFAFSADDTSPFFKVVNRLADLYITYRGRYVIMNTDGALFIPKKDLDGKAVPAKLTNTAVCAHVNRHIAISVYSGPHSAKFICFDVDDGSASTVKKIIDTCEEAGIPRDKIYVSTSGGKGYHVEIFFSGLVYVSAMKDFYAWVCFKADLDKSKVEFRPTHSHAIKLPLSKNFKTGNVCWYLDRDTLQPIEDFSYILEIETMSSDAFTLISQSVRDEYLRFNPFEGDDRRSSQQASLPLADISISDDLPALNRKGTTHKTILAIAIHLRKKGVASDAALDELNRWYEKQDRSFITDTDHVVRNDIKNSVKWVYGNSFTLLHRNEISPTYMKADIQTILSCRLKSDRYVLFLIMYYSKRYGFASISHERIANLCGLSPLCIRKAISRLEEAGLISKKSGKSHLDGNSFKKDANTYWPTQRVPFLPLTFRGDSFAINEPITAENFHVTFYSTLLAIADRAALKKHLSRQEFKNLEEYQNYEDQSC